MGDERDEQHTPTQSEFATFQVMANAEFTNLRKGLVAETSPSPTLNIGAGLLEVPDEDDQFFPEVFVKEEDEEENRAFESQPRHSLQHQIHEEEEEEKKSLSSSSTKSSFKGVTKEKNQQQDSPTSFSVPHQEKSHEFREPQQQQQHHKEQYSSASNANRRANQKTSPMYSSFKRDQDQEEENDDHDEDSRPRREKPEPQRKYKETTKAEIDAEKEGLLAELHSLERQGSAKLLRPLTMEDSLEEIQFQFDRIQAELNGTQMVDFAKSAIKMGSGMLEMVLKKAGIRVVDGYHTNLCKDMNKFNRPLSRMYKKYWRRGGMTPEAELGMLVFGSLAWTVVQNKMGSATAAFTGAPDVPVSAPEPTSTRNTSSAPRMRPPQMSSLNVPSSWTTNMADLSSEESSASSSAAAAAATAAAATAAATAAAAAAESRASEARSSEMAAKLAAKREMEKSMNILREAERKMAKAEELQKLLEERERKILMREESLDSQSYDDDNEENFIEEEQEKDERKEKFEEKKAIPKIVSVSSASAGIGLSAGLSAGKSARRRSTVINLDN